MNKDSQEKKPAELYAGEYGYETMKHVRLIASKLLKTNQDISLQLEKLSPLKNLFKQPKDVFDSIHLAYDHKLTKAQCTELFHLLNSGTIDGHKKVLNSDLINWKKILESIQPNFNKQVQVFIFKLKETYELSQFRKLFHTLNPHFSHPKEVQAKIKNKYSSELDRRQSMMLYNFIRFGSTEGEGKQQSLDLKNMKRILNNIDVSIENDVTSFVNNLTPETSKTHSLAEDIKSDFSPIYSQFQSPKELFSAIKSSFNVELPRAKAEALFHFITSGTIDGEGQPTSQDVFRLKQIFSEIDPQFLDKVKQSGEGKSEYGEFSSNKVRSFAKRLSNT